MSSTSPTPLSPALLLSASIPGLNGIYEPQPSRVQERHVYLLPLSVSPAPTLSLRKQAPNPIDAHRTPIDNSQANTRPAKGNSQR
ncbi:hypothetical protein EJ04DRAFT_512781 [Polyplosphaeria fusca]|uniref:Uncharacterized protein n=1 Tax=Polyplosphaeria fusca TaxID=682080 RepID=A0A9P4QUB0_9PLEO|nr:hypothetical protein EJ04DRAFT_512781 [Polyplosphaeria fusca]